MADIVSQERRSAMMARVRSRNTKPELVVRSILHAMGYRFRTHRSDLPGRPDISFSAKRVAIEVRGCFWHQHEGCAKANRPSTNSEWWGAKLQANVERDRRNEAMLVELGWSTHVVWECELKDAERLRAALVRALGPPRTRSGRHR